MGCFAGQAVVQFARNVVDQREYALKVFAVPHAFKAEAAMYRDESMANFLPRVEAMHDGTEEVPRPTALEPVVPAQIEILRIFRTVFWVSLRDN